MEQEYFDMRDCFKVIPANQEQDEYIIIIGKHLATAEKFPTKEAAEERLNAIDWNLISAFFYALKEADAFEKKQKRVKKPLKNKED